MSRPNCPYCGSVQTRYNSRNSNLFEEIHSCKNCGRQFSISFSNSDPKKKRGFFETLVLGVLGGVIIVIAVIFTFGRTSHQESATTTIDQSQSVADQELKPLNSNPVVTAEITPEQQPIEQEEFTPQAEEAAHSYTPTQDDYQNVKQEEKPESISDSQNQNDTLSIKTTIRNKSE